MKAKELMTQPPAMCTPETSLRQAAHLMDQHDCGCLPITENGSGRVIGVVTDRDIVTRAVAAGRSLDAPVREVMSANPSCCHADDDVKTVEQIMSERQVRRVPVVDADGYCLGMIAQADLAQKHVSARQLAKTVERISEPSPGSRRESQVGIHPALH